MIQASVQNKSHPKAIISHERYFVELLMQSVIGEFGNKTSHAGKDKTIPIKLEKISTARAAMQTRSVFSDFMVHSQ